ncbi:MAG: nucleotidyltransferase, partial [Verrucomicrobiota bacterium]
MKPTLLVLAAGMGSRYGGLKQIDPMGPSGETILDYSVFDALRAGFGKVVFIIRPDFEKDFRERVAARFAGKVEVDFAFQTLDRLPDGFTPPAGREKPWGTTHAILCAREQVRTPFAVINAD